MLQLEYIATDQTPDILTSTEHYMNELGVSTDHWDPANPPAGNLMNADLLVCNCSLNSFKKPAEVLSNMAATVKEGGFVLLHSLLKGETLGEIVSFLTTSDLQEKPGLLTQVNYRPFRSLSLGLDNVIFKCWAESFKVGLFRR